jgi:adenylate cyclase
MSKVRLDLGQAKARLTGRLPITPESDQSALGPAVPRDLKKAITIMRKAVSRPLSIGDLVRQCGVPERTLNKHFHTFFNLSPMRYLRRLRLAAARECLLAGEPGISVTEVAKRCGFQHFGRFAEQYRQCFGEVPSATLRRGSAKAAPDPLLTHGKGVTVSTRVPDSRLPRASRERPSIALLPCRAPPNEPALQWWAESIPDGIAAVLSPVRSLAVIVPRSLRAARLDPLRAGREFNARYFLAGKIVPAEKRLRVILSLIDCATGHHVWGDSFDGDRDQLLELHDLIVAASYDAILPHIRGAEIERARRISAQDLDAYGLSMRALPLVFASRPDASRCALELLEHAIEIDPDYGLATALAAWCHGQLIMYNGTPRASEDSSRALQLVRRAAILDDDDPLVLAARCAVHMLAQEFDVAEALVTRSLARDASSGWAWGRSGWLRSYLGDSETAIAHFGRAISLDLNAASRANSAIGIGSAHFSAGRYEEAAHWLRRGMCEQPGTSWANRSLSVSYLRLGERLKALESLDALRRFCPDLTVSQVVAAVPFRPDFLDRLGDGLSTLGLPP